MQKFDLHLASIPDHKAEMAAARIIVGTNNQISMHTAIEMVKNPPVLLYHNLELKDAEQYINNLKALNIGFKVSVAQRSPEEEAEEEKKRLARQTSAAVNDNAAAGSDQALGDFTDIKAHNVSVKKNAALDADNGGAVRKPDPRAVVDKAESPRSAQGSLPPEELQKSILAAIDHHHDRDSRSHNGRRRIGLADIAKAENAANRKNVTVAIGAAIIFLVIGLFLFFKPDERKIPIGKTPVVAKSGKTPASKTRAAGGESRARKTPPARSEQDRRRSQVSDAQREQSSAYADSAKSGAGSDPDKIIAFYKMAISFNRYNLQAWQGLLQAYRDYGKDLEARETEESIREIFGNEAMSVNSLVERFGDIADAYMNSDGTYRLEYKTRKSGRDDILREVFTMTRSIRSVCRCQNISIYASTGPGRGLIAHSTPKMSVHTFSTFSVQAEIVWLQ